LINHSSYTMHTHHVLLYNIRKGDAESYGKIWDLYHGKIFRFIYLKVPTRQDAEDITADTFLKGWHYIREGKHISSLQALFYTIARNLVIDFYRKRGTPPESLDDKNEDEIVIANRSDLTLEEKMMLKSDMEEVEDALRRLKDIFREIIVLHYLNGLSLLEISEVVQKSPGAVRVILHRGLKTLREILEKNKKIQKK